MKKRLLLGLILALAVSVLLALPAFALTEGDWEYQLLDGTAQITDYHGAGGDVAVPATLHGATVTKLDGFDMFVNKGMTSLTIPGTIQHVSVGYMMRSIEGFTSLTLEEGVETFTGSGNQEFPDLVEINLPSTLKKLGDYAFYRTGIAGIKIPAGVTEIGKQVFNKTPLKSIDLSYLHVTDLPNYCFGECKQLSSVQLPQTLQFLGVGTFADCTALQQVDLPATLTEICAYAFQRSAIQSIILPTGLKSIDGAFIGCANLQQVVIPYGVTTLQGGPFRDCANLTALYVPDTVTFFGYGYSLIQGSPNCIIYCTQDSATAKYCQSNKLSYLTDKSVNSPITVLYNGTRISFDQYSQNPVIVSGRTLVPLRSIFEAMGADVQWDDATRTATATRGTTTIRVQIGASSIEKNGQKIASDVPAQIVNGRTMVPVRVISEAFSCQVDWNAAGKTVLIRE